MNTTWQELRAKLLTKDEIAHDEKVASIICDGIESDEGLEQYVKTYFDNNPDSPCKEDVYLIINES